MSVFDGAVLWPGRSSTGSVIVALGDSLLVPLAPQLGLPEVTLFRKREAHLTLLSTREAEALARRLPESDWQAAFEADSWSWQALEAYDLLREDRASEPTRFSVIRHLHCAALNTFRQQLFEAAGMDVAETLPHVTLYTAGHERGIGLSSLADHVRFRIRALAREEWP